MIRVRLHTAPDDKVASVGAIAEIGEDAVWEVIESDIARELEEILNLLFGEDFEIPVLTYSPYPSYWRAREAIKFFAPGEILIEQVDDPFIDGAVY
jgi:hypothetical protein